MDNLFKVFWFEVNFENKNGVKRRPIVTFIYNDQAFSFEVLGVYSEKDKYKNNPYYNDFMYRVKDWKEANFKKPSYINVSRPLDIPFTLLIGQKYSGALTKRDIDGLKKFYEKYWSEH